MKSDWAKHVRLSDIVLLVCAIGLTLVTWATLCRTEGVPVWKPCCGVAATMLLTLAALTPHEPWAKTIQRIMGGWLIAAPWILTFAEFSAARDSYVIGGSLIAAMSLSRSLQGESMTFVASPSRDDNVGSSRYESIHP